MAKYFCQCFYCANLWRSKTHIPPDHCSRCGDTDISVNESTYCDVYDIYSTLGLARSSEAVKTLRRVMHKTINLELIESFHLVSTTDIVLVTKLRPAKGTSSIIVRCGETASAKYMDIVLPITGSLSDWWKTNPFKEYV